jgi:hypothetical protein
MRSARLTLKWIHFLCVFAIAVPSVAGAVTVSGIVRLDEDAIPDATVLLKGSDLSRVTMSNSVGEYKFENVPPGQYSLEAELAGCPAEKNVICVVDAHDAAYDIQLSAPRTSCCVIWSRNVVEVGWSGRVVDHAGRGVPGAHVVAEWDGKSRGAFTDMQGEFEIEVPVRNGGVSFEISRRGYTTKIVKGNCYAKVVAAIYPECPIDDARH